MRPELLIDFESYYSTITGISVTTQGLFNYARDSYAYIFSVVDINDPMRFQFCGTPEQFTEIDLPYDVDEVDPWAVNSNFDQTLWETLFPPFKRPWQCVSDLGTHQQFPRDLARLSHVVTGERLVDKKARDEMNGVHWNSLTLEGKTKMIRYCLTDSVIGAKTKRLLPPMTPFEARVAAHTRYINRRGIMIDFDLLERDIAFLEEERHRALIHIPWTDEIDRKTKKPAPPLSMAWLHRWCAYMGIPAPESRAKDSKELDDLMTDHPLLSEVIGYMRSFAKANTLLEKARAVEARVDDRGMMPIEFLYCGAPHTRRWSSKGVNIQNLDMFPIPFGPDEDARLEALKAEHGDQCWRHFYTTEVKPVPGGGPEDVMSVTRPGGVWTRRWLVPRPGKKFLILDFAQIEPRCLAWLVGDTALLAGVRSGAGIYQTHAEMTMNWRKGVPLKKADPRLYKLAKARVIGLGYGCGKVKFVVVAKKMANLEITPAESAITVDDYRRNNPLVVKYWEMWDEIIANTVRERTKDHHLDITMPNGENMRLWYLRPQYEVDEQTKQKKMVGWMALTVKNDPSSTTYRLWGGKVTENVTQRMARDIIAEKVLALFDAGKEVVFHSHDELILEVDEDAAGREQVECTEIMQRPVGWCPDLPLDVEGGIFDHYVK